MPLLAIDTSFDDTAAAVTDGYTVLSSILTSDLALHEDWGGVVPNLAREYHKQHIDAVIALAMKRAHVTWKDIEAIAVTRGPGLAIALEVGIAKAIHLATEYDKPLIAVNHMEGHLLSFLCHAKKRKNDQYSINNDQPHLLKPRTLSLEPMFPLLSVLISGGHTQFVFASKLGHYEVIGETQDDALGEAYDKVGRMLGLGFPAGRLVEQLAREGTPGKIVFPVPMRQVKSANTSYSGLKTAAMKVVKVEKEKSGGSLTKQHIANIAFGFQDAALKHLLEKLEFALHSVETQYPSTPLRTSIASLRGIAVGGGVAANLEVRKRLRTLAKKHNLAIFFPYSKKLCTDNAAMIGIAATHKLAQRQFSKSSELDRLPNWRIGK